MQHKGGSQPTGAGQGLPAAAPDLVQERAKAEVRKIEQEARKLEKEIEAILPAELVRSKAEAETEKARLDVEKLRRDARHYWIEAVKALSGLSSILLAIVAVGSLWVSLQTTRQAAEKADRDAQRLEREVVSSLIKDLSAEQYGLRATSARRLGAYSTDPKLSAIVVPSLVAALETEGQGEVQDAILQALEPALQAAQAHLARARSELNGQLVQLLSAINPSTGLPAQVMTVKGKQQGDDQDHPGAGSKRAVRRATVSGAVQQCHVAAAVLVHQLPRPLEGCRLRQGRAARGRFLWRGFERCTL
jgi:hypothetical protein